MSRTLALATVAALVCTSAASGQTAGTPSTAQLAPSPAAAAPPQDEQWFDHASLFVGLDGSKQPQDLGINANMGVRVAGNVGIPLVRRAGLGLQVGSAANFSDAAVHVLDQIEGTSRRSQFYATAALFQRLDLGLHWSLGYDLLHQRYYDDFTLGQVRGQAGYAATDNNDFRQLVHTEEPQSRWADG